MKKIIVIFAFGFLCQSLLADPDLKKQALSSAVTALDLKVVSNKQGVSAVNKLVELFPQLNELHVDYLPGGTVPDSVISDILSLEKLSVLSFSGDLRFTDAQLLRIAQKESLRELSFACP